MSRIDEKVERRTVSKHSITLEKSGEEVDGEFHAAAHMTHEVHWKALHPTRIDGYEDTSTNN